MPMDKSSALRDKWTIRKDVMILRQVIYKELMAMKIERGIGDNIKKLLTLTDEDKEWIDSQISFFFSEIPDSVMNEFRNEFSSQASAPTKVADKDLVSEDGIL